MNHATETVRAPMRPVGGDERVLTIDVLRGFALFGILLVNFYGVGATGLADRVANGFLFFFVSGKFYPLFSFLFGLGFGVMLLRSMDRGAAIVPVYLRRLAVLAVIGVVHYVFLWSGDILRDYAVLGALLLLFRNRSPRFLLAAALAAILIANAWGEYSVGNPPPLRRADAETAYLVDLNQLARFEEYRDASQALMWARSDGTYADLVVARARTLVLGLPWFFSVWTLQIFAMFLLGLYAAKRRLFEDVAAHRRLAMGVLTVGGVLGAAAMFLLVVAPELAARGVDLIPGFRDRFGGELYMFGGPLLTVAYIAGITLLCERARVARRLAILAPVGRMGLTNYLLQSVVGTSLYYGYTFGLHGKVGPALGILLSTAIFACQIPISHWWMARFRFGPAEWLWRSLTYMRLQPMRLAAPAPQPALSPEAGVAG
jgi:uncharacterized protein